MPQVTTLKRSWEWDVCLFFGWKEKSKLPAEGITFNGDISGDANKLIFPSKKVEKRNRGQILRQINKKF